jgi:hypothetical protein
MKMNSKSIYKQVEAVLDAFSSMGHKSAIQFPGRKQAWWTMLPISAEWADQFKKSVLPALRQRMMKPSGISGLLQRKPALKWAIGALPLLIIAAALVSTRMVQKPEAVHQIEPEPAI